MSDVITDSLYHVPAGGAQASDSPCVWYREVNNVSISFCSEVSHPTTQQFANRYFFGS